MRQEVETTVTPQLQLLPVVVSCFSCFVVEIARGRSKSWWQLKRETVLEKSRLILLSVACCCSSSSRVMQEVETARGIPVVGCRLSVVRIRAAAGRRQEQQCQFVVHYSRRAAVSCCRCALVLLLRFPTPAPPPGPPAGSTTLQKQQAGSEPTLLDGILQATVAKWVQGWIA